MIPIFEDKEFQSLDYGEKQRIATNYFKANLVDDDFKQLDTKEQDKILNNYLNSNIGEPTRTLGESLSDTAMQFGKGSGNLVKNIGDIGAMLGATDNSMQRLGKETADFYDKKLSPAYKAKQANQQREIDAEQGEVMKFWRTLETSATDPALFLGLVTEQLPQLAIGGVVGRGVGLGAKSLGAGAKVAGGLATGANVGTQGALQGADIGGDTYENLMKLDDKMWSANPKFQAMVEQGADAQQAKHEISLELARKAGAVAGGISLATNALPAMRTSERVLSGAMDGGKGLIKGATKGFIGEGLGEAVEESGGQVSSNYFQKNVNPNQSLTQGAGQAGAQGFLVGGPMGGVFGAVEGARPKTMNEMVNEFKAQNGDVSAVNNSFNVFGDLAQRSDAINPNIGDINYNQFTQSVDNTTTTPTNTVNVPKVDTKTTQAQEAPTQEAVSKMETTETPQVVKENLTAPTSAENAQVKEPKEVKKPADISEQEFNIIKEVKAVRPYLSNKDIVDAIRSNGKTNTEMLMALGSSKTYKAFKNEQQKAELKTYKQSKKDSIKFKFDGVTYEADGDTIYTTYKNKRIDNGYKFNPNGKTVFDIFGDNTRMAEAYIQAQGKSTKDFQPDYIAPIQNKLAKANAMEKQAMQNGDLETAKKISEAKQGMVKDLADKDLERLQQHPRYDELLDMRKDISAKDTQYSKKLANKRGTDANGEWYGATYEDNHASDFELTKADVKALQNGKATPKTIQKLRNDLGRLDNDPQYQLPIDEQQANDGLLFSKDQQPITKKESISYDGKDIGYIKTTKSGNFVNIDDIQVFKQGTGQGTQAIKNVMAQAEKDGTIVTLTSDAMRGKQNQKKNRELYEKLGFVKNSGANKIKGTKEEFYYKPQQQQANDGLLFSKEQPLPKFVHHGSSDESIKALKENFEILTPDEKLKIGGTGAGKIGLSLSVKPSIAKRYSQALGGNSIASFEVNPNAKVLRVDTKGDMIDDLFTDEEMHQLIKDGYDAILDVGDETEFEYRALTKNAIKPKDGLMFSREDITPHVKDFKTRIQGKEKDIEGVIRSYSYGKAKAPSEVYRGVATEGELINSKNGFAGEGYGLYTTLNKSLASDYGKVTTLNGKDALPKNPLVFSDYNNYEIFMQQLMYKVAGYKRASEFGKLNPNEIIHAVKPDADGIQIGKGNKTFWVKFPDIKEVREKQEYDVLESKGKSKGTTTDKAKAIVRKTLGNSKASKDVEVVQSFDNLPDDLKKRMELMSTAYHGTPHTVDKFSTKHIGSGEGAQAYGYGLYFADSKEVAEFYRTSTMSRDNRIAYDKAVEEIKNLKSLIEEAQSNPKLTSQLPKLKEFLVKAEKTKQELSQSGNLYRVELKPKEEEYLLWDKPLDEQSLHVKEALQKELDMYRKSEGAKGAYVNNSSGEKLYKEFIYTYGSDKKASERLNELGIKGIKYEDGNSRSRDVNKNHNYVIFNDDDVGTPELLQSADGVVRGVFDPKSGKAYLVADTMAENEVKGVLLHELLHRAINNEVKRQSDKQGQTVSRLDAILGSKLEQVTTDLKSLEAKGDKDVLEAVNKAKEAGTPKQHMLEETLAYLLQNQTNKYSTPLKEFLLKVATAIKDFAKRVAVKMGIEPNWLASQITADDIANVLKSYALDDGSAKTSGEPMMSKISDRMKRLMEWHKDSAPETKNADGTPKVFYHGTMAKKQFYEFNTESSPSWFTPNKSYAGAFAPVGGNIFEVYLHVKKPMWVGDIDGIINDVSLKRLSDNSGVPLDKLKDIRKNIKGVNIFNITNSKEFVDIAKSMGYDGLEAIEGRTQTLAVFDPTQIKSVNNKGTFDESNPNILFSRTDDVKKLAKQARSKAKQFLSDQLNKTALERSIDMLSKPKDEAYSAFKSLVMNTLPQKYMDALGEMHKSKNRIEQQVGVVKASLSTLSLEQRTQLHDYIVNDVKTIDPELKKLADKISGIITNLGQELIDKGILEAHVVKAWEGKFLKRQFKNEEAVLGTSKFKTYFFGSKKSLAKQYTRGLQLQAETEAEAIKAINGYLKAYGHDEISGMGVNDAIKYLKDNGLFADGVQWKSDGKIKVREMKNGEYEIIRDFTKAEREKMEEVTDAGITVPDTILRLSTLLEHGKMLKATTELNDYVTDDKTMGNSMKWTQIENKPQYGVLAGKWVRPDIASDIIANQNAFYERDGLVDTWLKGLSLWKKSRTVWSPTGHFNNFVSNLFIKHGLGLDPFKNTLEAGKMLSQLQEYEALEVKDAMGTLTAEEKTKFKTMKSYLSSAIELRDNGMLGHTQLLDINRGFEQDGITEEKGALGKLDDAVSKLYKGGDTIHRLSSYMLIKEAGYDSETAMLVVDKLFPDYSKPMPKVWRWARDTGISPFISWTYYTLPAISKITMANPARTLGAYSALGAIGFLGMLLGSDGDWEEAIQSFLNLPEDAIGRRMPIWKNDKGEVLTWKVDRLMPFMDLASPLLGMASGAVKGYKESQGDVGHTAIKAVSGGFGGAGNTVRSYFAGPTINALLFNTAGKDSYTNNDIVKKDATDKQRMYLTAKYLVEQYAPLPTPLMRMYDMTEAMVKGEDERKRNAITVPRSPIENVIGLAGINVLRYDQKALDKQMKDFSAEAQDFTEIKQKLTKLDGMLKESKERKDIDTYNKIISKHQDEMRTLGDLKKTETQLRKLKSMRDEAMMSSDDKAVLELNKQINQIMKAFNERNKK